MTKISDSWETPQWLFDKLNKEFNFDIDLCATAENSKCDIYYDDYLNDEYNGSTYPILLSNARAAFCNPPYSNPLPFIQKAWEDSKYCKIVLLVKVDPSTKWWSIFWNYNIVITQDELWYKGYDFRPPIPGTYLYNGPKPGCAVRFLPKRVYFDPPKEMNAWKEKVNCGCIKQLQKNRSLAVRVRVQGIKCTKCRGTGEIDVNKWWVKCDNCEGTGGDAKSPSSWKCSDCNGKGKKQLSGPSFSSCILVFDRRDL